MIFRHLFDTKQKSHCKKSRWKYIENENRQYYLSNEKQKSMFPIASPMDARFGIVHPIFACPIDCATKI